MNTKPMTDKMVKAAFELETAAHKYKELYEKEYGSSPVIFIHNDETKELFLISDSKYSSDLIDIVQSNLN